ncbi:DNA replication factor CDT1 like family protein [Cryptosporidium meleagridis]|uniref:DNA replication factor CDT1 like family protein n=1 Tax=Cryptosporidium meleagridis TaxID=93969 RepID=A0A2P4YX55_9CRYT|nr:DNA replication factor CDT1 like family protein [Cryptosporidium meleagridis]
MTRKSKKSQSILSENNELLQTRLDIGYGIKSNIFINDLYNQDDLKKNQGVQTRSMTRSNINKKNFETQVTNIADVDTSKLAELENTSPKKKSKTRLKNSRSSKFTTKTNQEIKNNHNIINIDNNLLSDCKEKLVLINNPEDVLASKHFETEKMGSNDISHLDSLLPPTAPESQNNSPTRENNSIELIPDKTSCFTNVCEFEQGNRLEALLSKDQNTNLSIYKHLFKHSNKANFDRLKKIKLSEKYEYLIEIFQGLEIVLRLLERRQKPFFYPTFIKEQVENITKKTFSLDNLLRILWISPQLISIKWCKTNKLNNSGLESPKNTLSEFNDQYELEIILNDGVNNPLKRLSHSNINERVDIFRFILIEFTMIQQEMYLRQIMTKNMEINTDILELKGWSSFFNIENCVEIPKAKLPPKKIINCNLINSFQNNGQRISSSSLTPNIRSLYNLKIVSSLVNLEESNEKEKNNRRSLSADNVKNDESNQTFTTPLRSKNSICEANVINLNKEKDKLVTDSRLPNNTSMLSTPIRNIRSSYMLSRSISPTLTPNNVKIQLSNTQFSKPVTILSKNKNLLTPSQRNLLESVKRREKIKEISAMINVEDEDYNKKLDQVKNEIWTIQQLSFVFLRTKKLIPATQLPLLAKRLTTHARNSPEIGEVQDSIIRLSNKWPEYIKLGDSTVEKGVKLVKLHINDENISNIIVKLNKEKDSIFKQREEFRLETISKYQ